MQSLAACTDVFDNNDWSYSSTPKREENTTNTEDDTTFSDFGDSACGEPLFDQHIQLDFTPNEEIDTDYVQNKCCEFWNFINSRPDIQHLKEKMKFDSQMSEATTSSVGASFSGAEDNARRLQSKERTALSMLELAEDRGLIDRTFEAKIHESHCTMGSREYKELQQGKKESKKNVVCGPYCHYCIHPVSGNKPGTCPCIPPKLTPLKALVKTMEDWDPKHPKSFDPPSHPPSLQHCVLQRIPTASTKSK